MGPLSGVKVIEIAGIGPGPFCAMCSRLKSGGGRAGATVDALAARTRRTVCTRLGAVYPPPLVLSGHAASLTPY